MFKGLMGSFSRWLENNPSAGKAARAESGRTIPAGVLLGRLGPGRTQNPRYQRSGAYIVTPERWYVGTIVRLILQGYKTTPKPDGGHCSFAVQVDPRARDPARGRWNRRGVHVFDSRGAEEPARTFYDHSPSQREAADGRHRSQTGRR